jgi:hypothetical protein
MVHFESNLSMSSSAPQSSPLRRELTRFPDVKTLKSVANKSLLAVRLHFAEDFRRLDILESKLVSRGVYDRAIKAFGDHRIPGVNGRPGKLNAYEEGMLVATIEKEMQLGHVLTYREISEEVFPFFSIVLSFNYIHRLRKSRIRSKLMKTLQNHSALLGRTCGLLPTQNTTRNVQLW